MNMNVQILKRSHSKVKCVRKYFTEMEIILNMSVHVPEENHSIVLDALINYIIIYKATMGKVLKISIL